MGTIPSRRTRRASFLPRPSRCFAWILNSFFSAMISPYKLSATQAIVDLQLPIAESKEPCGSVNRQLAINNRQPLDGR
jgi:hypothetical protein